MQPSQYPIYNQQQYYCDPANTSGGWAWHQQQQQQPVYSSGIYEQYYTAAARSSTVDSGSNIVRNELATHVVDGLVEMNKALRSPPTTAPLPESSTSSSPSFVDPERIDKLREIYTILSHQNVATIHRPDSKSPEPFINFLNKLGKDQKITRLDKETFTKLVVRCRHLTPSELKLVNRALSNGNESCIVAAKHGKTSSTRNNSSSELVELMQSFVPRLPAKPSELFTPIVCCVCNNLCNEVLTCQKCNKPHFICRLCRPYLLKISTTEEQPNNMQNQTSNKLRLAKCCLASVFCALQTSKEPFF